ncbi:hypothetical protein CFC21_037581 [Triticum aestivum]|uniref:Uncharacterized protein n=4 Tax=Triticum TaxID=4564 RepID=A0A9R0VS70_TRITD|nr:uncharacterized protein LOC119272674 [Triticum dicoccoides]XP_044337614.1 uncharacterized protein LOC123059017 [Triticum aestivum]XP_048568477.1 uncharacterized protein LOC125549016 [Triticum urartu]XP_048568478.1 uncharacterized protein LOC125549017 [Triticum urartu]VAH67746.1 unnamed protein product [Triticum turgidum subsp. durum]EMS53694.1 hypothetical protein TRIUR3_31809 [Triticum urartu]KAF7025399.1 hypothetical protein CFC21_037581 [Triticum aestivum]
MAGARNNELRMTLLGLALLGLLLLSHTAAPVEAAAGVQENSFSMNGAGGRSLNSFSMNTAESAEVAKGGKAKPAAGDF